jgi:AcrR family transcriptional regulator
MPEAGRADAPNKRPQGPDRQPSEDGAPAQSRVERRKAATRQALLNAGQRMLADGTANSASIQDITDAADIGFGSFYNHFEDKAALFEAAAEQVFEHWGDYLDHSAPDSTDPAVIYATAFRQSGRMLIAHPVEARLVVQHGLRLLDSGVGLGPRARRDLSAAVTSGRFTIANANIELALSKTAGYLFALIHTWLLEPDLVGVEEIDDAVEELMRAFGIKPGEAKRLAHSPLKELAPPQLA